jgi:hypothetical protein
MFEKEFPNLSYIILKIYIKFGYNHRMVNSIEELSELQKELCKILRNNNINNLDNVIEEMADVYLSMEEVKKANGISDEKILKIMKEKVLRGVR